MFGFFRKRKPEPAPAMDPMEHLYEFDHRNSEPPRHLPYDLTGVGLHGLFPEYPADRTAEATALFGLSQKKPRKAIAPLESLVKEFPNVPMGKSWLMMAYDLAGWPDEAKAIGDRLLLEHPDYLFARLPAALRTLEKRHPSEVPAILNHRMELHLFYPDRKLFHLTEAVGMWTVLHQYYLQMGRFSLAVDYIKRLGQVAPNHPLFRQYIRNGDTFDIQPVTINGREVMFLPPGALDDQEREPRRHFRELPSERRRRRRRQR